MDKISTIIFDLGDVLLDLNQDRTLRAFNRLGIDLSDVNDQTTLFNDFETGKIGEEDFRHTLRAIRKGEVTNEQIDTAWNEMLLWITPERIDILKQLRKHFRIYLLSNTNSIHITWFKKYIEEQMGWQAWCDLFDKQYFSYEIGLRKPHTSIYEYILNDIHKEANECLFIDDNRSNIRGAAKVGIHVLFASKPLDAKMHADILTIAKNWHQVHQ
jgi:glucose-1-phosphatase